MMTKELYGTKDAAEYLGMSLPNVKYHVRVGNLCPVKIGKTLVFTRAQLDAFQKNRRPPGRPRKQEAS